MSQDPSGLLVRPALLSSSPCFCLSCNSDTAVYNLISHPLELLFAVMLSLSKHISLARSTLQSGRSVYQGNYNSQSALSAQFTSQT